MPLLPLLRLPFCLCCRRPLQLPFRLVCCSPADIASCLLSCFAACNQISELHNKDDIKRACKAVIDALTRSKLAFARYRANSAGISVDSWLGCRVDLCLLLRLHLLASSACLDSVLMQSCSIACSTPMMEIKKKEVAKATVRDIFGDEKPDSAELKQEVKNFLTSGMLLQKHSNNAAPRSRHVYVTTDLK